jgi:hypothetical protein
MAAFLFVDCCLLIINMGYLTNKGCSSFISTTAIIPLSELKVKLFWPLSQVLLSEYYC